MTSIAKLKGLFKSNSSVALYDPHQQQHTTENHATKVPLSVPSSPKLKPVSDGKQSAKPSPQNSILDSNANANSNISPTPTHATPSRASSVKDHRLTTSISNTSRQSVGSSKTVAPVTPPPSHSHNTNPPTNPPPNQPPASAISAGSMAPPHPPSSHHRPASSASTSTLSSSVASSKTSRLEMLPDGSHQHHLKSAKRQEKLGSMLWDMMAKKKVRGDAVSAMPNLTESANASPSKPSSPVLAPIAPTNGANGAGAGSGTGVKNDLSLISGLVSQLEKGERDVSNVVHGAYDGQALPGSTNNAGSCLAEKYGKCQGVIGKGAYGIVRISQKYDSVKRRELLFAIKEFKKRTNEDEVNYHKRLSSEFCISSSLHHKNIIETLDLMKDNKGIYCQVMEYCEGGDLYSLILASAADPNSNGGGLQVTEADCFFKQIMRGIVYMHSMGVAHCDLKPENILLTTSGVIKISDFGNGECFQMAWENEIHMSSGVCGSKPYISPEEFSQKEFDPRAADIWATGVIYMAMRSGRYLWNLATPDDVHYNEYLQGRKQKQGYQPIESLKRSKCRNVIYSILDPSPSRRITGKQVLNSEWGRSIQVCAAGDRGYP